MYFPFSFPLQPSPRKTTYLVIMVLQLITYNTWSRTRSTRPMDSNRDKCKDVFHFDFNYLFNFLTFPLIPPSAPGPIRCTPWRTTQPAMRTSISRLPLRMASNSRPQVTPMEFTTMAALPRPAAVATTHRTPAKAASQVPIPVNSIWWTRQMRFCTRTATGVDLLSSRPAAAGTLQEVEAMAAAVECSRRAVAQEWTEAVAVNRLRPTCATPLAYPQQQSLGSWTTTRRQRV